MSRIVVFAALIGGFLISHVPESRAQTDRNRAIQIEHLEQSPDDPGTRVVEMVRETLEFEFELRGIRLAEANLSRLVLGARSVVVGESEYIIAAVVEGSSLTEGVLDAAAEHEIWYADKPKPENLEEGRFVRQMMTRDIIGSMMHVHGVRLLLFPVDDLQMEASLYVDDYIDRMSCDPNEDCGMDGME